MITNSGDNILSGVRLPLNLVNQNNVGIPRHNNMSLSWFKSSVDSCAATHIYANSYFYAAKLMELEQKFVSCTKYVFRNEYSTISQYKFVSLTNILI